MADTGPNPLQVSLNGKAPISPFLFHSLHTCECAGIVWGSQGTEYITGLGVATSHCLPLWCPSPHRTKDPSTILAITPLSARLDLGQMLALYLFPDVLRTVLSHSGGWNDVMV